MPLVTALLNIGGIKEVYEYLIFNVDLSLLTNAYVNKQHTYVLPMITKSVFRTLFCVTFFVLVYVYCTMQPVGV